MNPAPTRPAITTAARLPATPAIGGASPAARLLLEAVAVVVPFVCESSEVTRAVRLVSEAKAAVTVLAFLQVDVE